MSNHLVSFATPEYYGSQNILIDSAKRFGIHTSHRFRDSNLKGLNFFKDNANLFDEKRGYGYWLWKPYIILEILQNLDKNDCLLYADCGLEVINSLEPLIDICHKNDGLVFFGLEGFNLKSWTKRECLISMNVDYPSIHDSTMVTASCCLFKNNSRNIEFLKAWLAQCQVKRLIDDSLDKNITQHPEFKQHRHDQSILSVLCHKNNFVLFLNRCHVGPRSMAGAQIFYHHRKRIAELSITKKLKMKIINLKKRLIKTPVGRRIHSRWLALRFSLMGKKENHSFLHFLGTIFGTDKVNIHHSFGDKSYLDIYDQYFRGYRTRSVKLLEIGVKGGHSLRTWKAYFENADIYGLDINPECESVVEDRIDVYIGSQNDSHVLENMASKAGTFDIIIDDGSHINTLMLESFEILFPYLQSGGIYIFEDMYCSYQDLSVHIDEWDGELLKNKSEGVELYNERSTMNDFFSEIIKKLDHSSGDILTIHFWSQLVIITKK